MKRLFIFIFLLITTNSWAAAPTRAYTYATGEVITAEKNNQNENLLFNYLVLGVDNIRDGVVVNADISSIANIQADKLNLSSIAQDISLNGDLTLSSGKEFKIGSTVWNDGDSIDTGILTDTSFSGDLGNVTVTEGVWDIVESDPTISTINAGKWCTSDGDVIICDSDEPTSENPQGGDVIWNGATNGASDLSFAKFDGPSGKLVITSGLREDSSYNVVSSGTITAVSFISTGTGVSTITQGLTVNSGGGGTANDDFIAKTDNSATAFQVDASADKILAAVALDSTSVLTATGIVATSKLKVPNGTTCSATCTTGDICVDNDAQTGQRLYVCESPSNWVKQGDGSGGSPLLCFSATSGTSSFYMGPGTLGVDATEDNVSYTFFAVDRTISDLSCGVDVAPGAGKNWAVTVRENQANSVVTCTIADSATTCSDVAHSFTLDAGNGVTIGWVATGSPADAGGVTCSFDIQ